MISKRHRSPGDGPIVRPDDDPAHGSPTRPEHQAQAAASIEWLANPVGGTWGWSVARRRRREELRRAHVVDLEHAPFICGACKTALPSSPHGARHPNAGPGHGRTCLILNQPGDRGRFIHGVQDLRRLPRRDGDSR